MSGIVTSYRESGYAFQQGGGRTPIPLYPSAPLYSPTPLYPSDRQNCLEIKENIPPFGAARPASTIPAELDKRDEMDSDETSQALEDITFGTRTTLTRSKSAWGSDTLDPFSKVRNCLGVEHYDPEPGKEALNADAAIKALDKIPRDDRFLGAFTEMKGLEQVMRASSLGSFGFYHGHGQPNEPPYIGLSVRVKPDCQYRMKFVYGPYRIDGCRVEYPKCPEDNIGWRFWAGQSYGSCNVGASGTASSDPDINKIFEQAERMALSYTQSSIGSPRS